MGAWLTTRCTGSQNPRGAEILARKGARRLSGPFNLVADGLSNVKVVP